MKHSKRGWLLILVPVVLTAVIVVSTILYFAYLRGKAIDRTYDTLLSSAREQSALLQSAVEGQSAVLRSFAEALVEQGNYADTESVRARMAATVRSSSYSRIFIATPDGVARSDLNYTVDVSDRDYFRQSMAGEEAFVWVPAGKWSGQSAFTVSMPIVRGGRVDAVLIGTFSEKAFGELLDVRAYSGRAFSLICDNQGNILIHVESDASVFAADMPLAGYTNLIEGFKQTRVLDGGTLAEVEQNLREQKQGMLHLAIAGEERYVVYAPVGLGGWFSVTAVEADVANAQERTGVFVAAGVITLVVVCAAAILLFTLIIQRRGKRIIAAQKEGISLNEQRYRVAAEQSNLLIALYDIKRDTLECEQRFASALQLERLTKNIPQTLIDKGIFAPESVADITDFYACVRAGEQDRTCVFRAVRPDGKFGWFRSRATILFDASGAPQEAVITFVDISEQREKEMAFERWQNEIAAKPKDKLALFEWNLTRDISEGESGELIQYFKDMPIESFDARTRDYAENNIVEEDRGAYIAFLDRARLIGTYRNGIGEESMEYREIQGGNEYHWMRITVQIVPYPDSDELKAYLTILDIDDEKREALAAKSRAEIDPLTGVLNRAALEARVEEMLNSGGDTPHAFLLLDIDGFKLVNDSFGHVTGDRVLVDITKRLRSVLNKGDFLGRLGGDEFVLCFEDASYDALIEKRAGQICSVLRRDFENGISLSGSIGIAVYPRDGESFGALYENADAALYQTKAKGKAGFEFYRPGMGADLASQLTRAEPAAAKRRILVVDDNEMNCAILGEIFKDEYIVDQATDGKGALSIMRRYGAGITVVLLDLFMPRYDGFWVMEKMRESPLTSSIPIIIVSGEDERSVSLRAIKYGASDFVTKPVDPALIRLRVSSVVSRQENDRLRIQNSYLTLQRNEEARYRSVLDGTGTVVIEFNCASGVFIYDSAVSEHIAGRYDTRPFWDILLSDGVADKGEIAKMRARVDAAAQRDIQLCERINVRLNDPQGKAQWFRMGVFNQVNEFAVTERVILTFNNVTSEVLAEQKLHYQAERDELTGLNNRQTFLHLAAQRLKKAKPGQYVIACFDIEKFKVVNDLYGYAEGDKLLCGIADLVMNRMQGKGLCCRISADRFVALYPNEKGLEEVLLHFIDETTRLPHKDMVTLCFGLYEVQDPSMSVSSMMDRATLAQQSVKGKYDKHLAWYAKGQYDEIVSEQEMVLAMETALESGQFDIYLQPQYNHTTGKIVGAEALVRWLHPEKGVLSPGVFIPLFEKNGFISQLDEAVWRRTAQLYHDWLSAGNEPLAVSVNVSRLNIYNPLLLETLTGIVKEYDIPVEYFRLEITESAFVDDAESIIDAVTKLKAAGFIVEMDDFGSGYSSLNALKEVPVDIVKLDARFLSGGDKERGGAILESVMRMAHNLQMKVIAEGVETREQADFLTSIGCNIVQGYLYAKPMPVPQFEALLEKEERSEEL